MSLDVARAYAQNLRNASTADERKSVFADLVRQTSPAPVPAPVQAPTAAPTPATTPSVYQQALNARQTQQTAPAPMPTKTNTAPAPSTLNSLQAVVPTSPVVQNSTQPNSMMRRLEREAKAKAQQTPLDALRTSIKGAAAQGDMAGVYGLKEQGLLSGAYSAQPATEQLIRDDMNRVAQNIPKANQQVGYEYTRPDTTSLTQQTQQRMTEQAKAQQDALRQSRLNRPQSSSTPAAAAPKTTLQQLTADSTEYPIAMAYSQFVEQNGGDTEANRAQAVQYLQSLGIPQDMINSAYQSFLRYQGTGGTAAPGGGTTSAVTQGTGLLGAATQNSWDTLNTSSGADSVIGAYRDFIGSRGGDTAANRLEANQYLQGLGFSQDQINAMYQQFQGPQNSWDPLNTSSGADSVIGAYRDFIGSRGGDTAANREEANQFLLDRGFSQDQINEMYQRFLGPGTGTTPGAGTTPGTGTTPGAGTTPDFSLDDYLARLRELENRQYENNLDLFDRTQNPNSPPPPPSSPSSPNGPVFDRQVTNDELVESRIASLIESGHPLLEQVRQQTLAAFASRGLLNSSMAMQAAQEAVLAKAFEIASQDAQTFNRQGMANQSFQNEFAGRDQVQGFTRENQYNDYLYNQGLMNAEYANRGNMASLESGLRGNLLERELSMRNQFDVASEGRQELANSRQRYQTTLQQYQADYQNQYQNIVMAYDMDEGSKVAAIDNLNDRYQVMFDNANSIYEKIPGWEQEWLVVRA